MPLSDKIKSNESLSSGVPSSEKVLDTNASETRETKKVLETNKSSAEAADKDQNTLEVGEPAQKKASAPTIASQPVASANDSEIIEIKNILGEGLGSSYSKMNPNDQKELLEEEEEVAVEIQEVLSKDKVKTQKIFKLIFKWLKVIPFASNFFAKQEAKIKTDRIIDLEHKK